MRAQIREGVAASVNASDEELMTAIQEKRPQALAVLYDRYGAVLKALTMRIVHNEAEAEDLLMEIYMEIWHQAPHYSPDKGRPISWLVTMTRRRAIDRLRKRQSYHRAEERFQQETESQPSSWLKNPVDMDVEIQDLRGVLARILASLPPNQQQAIRLAYYRGMSQREIAAFTGTPLGTIKTRLELGLRKLAGAIRSYRHEF